MSRSQNTKRHHVSVTDTELKEKGNRYFSERKYEEAIRCYSQAIQKNPSNPIYYTNRALSGLRLSRFQDVAADCRSALELEPNMVKAHFYLGQALCGLDMLDDGVKHLQRTVDLAKEQRLNYGDDMTQVLRHWRKRRFSIQEEKRLAEEIELQTYLSRLIREDRERQIDEFKAQQAAKGDSDETELNAKIASVEKFSDNCMNEMNNLFAKVDDRRRKREVPDYLCGKISFEILRDPVITPSGITYERKDLEEHLMRVGHFDPITRVTLTSDQLMPNYAMKEVVDAFVTENEWALDI
ncbi:E3 ubiquitin-protein ligase CHIP [Folsomia candida]|uniref:E3 ubiquitin-protein ligase CHIP n=1 Tax=Folsomia candida TaxID=158441 RepID=A0A226DKN5_FOLCA|nr:E3 ubiquitin-protein ligase CHIP [Folsomia candida]XP_021960985.1 E3 ubiquitin-protein ligase CHIP [Folsomia candida]OXA45759.1 E3 ubiquitin-protein ligase CHIP [Folsomia candida]